MNQRNPYLDLTTKRLNRHLPPSILNLELFFSLIHLAIITFSYPLSIFAITIDYSSFSLFSLSSNQSLVN